MVTRVDKIRFYIPFNSVSAMLVGPLRAVSSTSDMRPRGPGFNTGLVTYMYLCLSFC